MLQCKAAAGPTFGGVYCLSYNLIMIVWGWIGSCAHIALQIGVSTPGPLGGLWKNYLA